MLSRDAIFSELWSQYGSTPSNSSLNTYMSLIRKAFSNLGMESEVIVTIPKTGFLFNPDIDVEETEMTYVDESDGSLPERMESHIDDADLPDGNNNIIQGETVQRVPYKKEEIPDTQITEGIICDGKKKKKTLLVSAAAMLIIATVSAAGYLMGGEKARTVVPVNIGKTDTCDILFLPVYTGEFTALSSDDSNFIIRQSGFICKPGGVFYLYSDKRVALGQTGKVFVSYCELRNETVKNCTNYIGSNLKLPVTSTP